MAKIIGNADSGIESDPECDSSVPLVVETGDSVLTSRDDTSLVVVDGLSSGISSETSPSSSSSSAVESMEVTTDSTSVETASIEERQSFQLVMASGETLTVSLDQISEYETRSLPEFFNGTKGKSAESYLQIRNHFLNHWVSVKPKRFSYHQMLRRLSSLHLGNASLPVLSIDPLFDPQIGNVTAFSRIQKFLETNKSINTFGEKPQKKSEFRRKSQQKRLKKSHHNNQMTKLGVASTQSPPIEGGDIPTERRTRPNPFKLVPLETYFSEQEAPFAVRLSMEALAIIDIHAHCVRTEVIGLLGGRYCPQTRELRIMTSEPCQSTQDHDLQCDMEPVSQMEAKEALEAKDCQVVGWYHSHPTFVPNPSLRDLETQNNFQTIFSNDSKQPFVALILSPYCWTTASLVSQFKCLFLSDQTQNDYKIPFELNPRIIRTDKMVFHITHKLQDLCSRLQTHSHRVRLLDKIKRFRGRDGQTEISHLEKLCYSLQHFLKETGLSSVECRRLLDQIKDILIHCLQLEVI